MTERIMGFDFGTKRIGVAIGVSITATASPLQTIAAEDGLPNWSQIEALCKEWQVDAFVVGFPTNIDGSEQKISERASQFGKALEKRFKLPVHYVDERLTTVEAKQLLFESGGYKKLKVSEIDSFAAKLILEQFFASRTNTYP